MAFKRRNNCKINNLNSIISERISGKRIPVFYRDLLNKIKYGWLAPAYAERIWIEPSRCRYSIKPESIINATGHHAKRASGKVINFSSMENQIIPIFEVEKIKYSLDHWENGISWEDTGIYEYMEKRILKNGSADSCYNIDDVIKRYKKLDLIFEQIKREGRFRIRTEIKPDNFRESGGILIHIGPEGEPIFGWRGCHRIAIAIILGLKFPAEIGCVHINSISYLPEYRK
jgi:flagellin-specific chaperone FliS